jgi:hypothetical protein
MRKASTTGKTILPGHAPIYRWKNILETARFSERQRIQKPLRLIVFRIACSRRGRSF